MDLALFDFDGTITTRETFGDFIRRAVSPRRRAAGTLLLAPLVAGYRLGLVSGPRVRAAVVRFGLRGARESVLRACAQDYAQTVLPGLLRPVALQRIDWHRARGDRIVVVSGAFDLYLQPWCDQHGLELLCSALEVRDGVLSGRYRGAQCVGAEKARRVRERYDLTSYGAVHAYGDTPEDAELLALARHRSYRWQDVAGAGATA